LDNQEPLIQHKRVLVTFLLLSLSRWTKSSAAASLQSTVAFAQWRAEVWWCPGRTVARKSSI